ncbi:MAG TPA: hypothetical protein VJ725_08140 [Thermoanaerobaculia bacterium]|nr:hypothetical protein [Thermoanaerobaculia bacterium]
MDWETLGAVDPRSLVDARLQLHWAAQAAAAVGKQLLPGQPDYSEQSFTWDGQLRALVQGLVPGRRPFRSAIRFADPALLFVDGDGSILRELSLDGRTLDDLYEWVREEGEQLSGDSFPKALERPGEDFPVHPVGSGAPFAVSDPAAFAEVGRYFANADRALQAVAAQNPGASPVRCWPHHFDIATLIGLDKDAHSETARSIGVGLSPGDGGRAEPYFYVTPWPYPETRDLPPLAGGGIWNTEGWVGAVLEASTFAGSASNGGQGRRVAELLDSAVAACRRLLEGS